MQYTSASAKSFCALTGRNLSDEFLDEASRQLDLEQGRISIPTVQGLTLMYAISCYRGTDRAGQVRQAMMAVGHR